MPLKESCGSATRKRAVLRVALAALASTVSTIFAV